MDGARLDFVGFLPLRDYLAQYHRIDIVLDPFPYAGGTTTCDALWMGAPAITLRGKTAVARAGVSLLCQIGMPQFIADNRRQYVKLATQLANDPTQLADLRQGMRARMRASSLMDGPSFARDVETVYRTIWRKWTAAGATP